MLLPYSPFQSARPSYSRAVPVPGSDPDAAPLVTVTFAEAWLPYVVGALQQLLQNTTFDVVQNSSEQELVQNQAATLLSIFCGAQVEAPITDLRINPEDNCTIQVSRDSGTTWSDAVSVQACATAAAQSVLDAQQSGTNPNSKSQPGQQEGGGSPTPGQCFEMDITVNANGLLTIPVAIGNGWSITITKINGMWSDGNVITVTNWYCSTGDTFILGLCTGFTVAPSPSDPDQAAHHMQLILALPGGAFHAIVDGESFNVPAATPDGHYYLLANDGNLSDNSGAISMHLKACNSNAANITYEQGQGPSPVSVGEDFTITALLHGSDGYTILVDIDPCVQLTCLAIDGTFTPVPGTNSIASLNCAGTLDLATGPIVATPADFGPTRETKRFSFQSSTPFTVQFHLDALA